MIIILKNNASPESVEKLDELLKEQGLKTNHIQGANQHIIGLIGDTSAVDMHNLYAQDCIERSSVCRSLTKRLTASSTPMTLLSKQAAERSATVLFRSSQVPAPLKQRS